MGTKIRRTGPSSIDVLPNLRTNADPHSQRVVESHNTHNDTSRGQEALRSVEPATEQGRIEFELALQARGLDGRLAKQLLELFDSLLASDGQSSTFLAALLYSAVDAGILNINRQFFETASMLIGAVTDGRLASANSEIIFEHFAEIIEGGRISRKQHAELQSLIDTPNFASDVAPEADVDLSKPPEPVESLSDSAPVEEAVSASVEPPPAAGDTRPLNPAVIGVDPQQWDTEYGQPDDVPGVSGPEFIHALYGSGAMSGLSQAKRLEFSQYAGSVFIAYANDDDLLFDDEIMLMQNDGILVETGGGWALDFSTVTELIDSPLIAIPD